MDSPPTPPAAPAQPKAPTRFRLSAIVERRLTTVRGWRSRTWYLTEVIAGDHASAREGRNPVELSRDDTGVRYLWRGLKLELFRDACEGYLANLASGRPVLFLIANEDETDGELRPLFLTADQNEASGHMEMGDTVLSAPMPAGIFPEVERFARENYIPVVKKKRKRESWSTDRAP